MNPLSKNYLSDSIKNYSPFLFPLLLLLTIIFTGALFYHFHESARWVDAFYMTVITVATVGFGEIFPLSDTGRIFTAFLILSSFGIFAYSVSSITKFVIDGEFNNIQKNRKLKSELEKLDQHVIICGYGRNGKQAAQVLKKFGQRFVVIEEKKELTDAMTHDYKHLVITGDSTHDEVLIRAGIERARALITTLPIDADNLFIVLTARSLNPKLSIISRASEDSSDRKLRIAGANNVIMPDKIGGAHMAELVMKPDVIEFIDFITGQGSDTINLEEFTFENLPEHLQNKSIKELEIRNKSGANIIGFKTAEGHYTVNPSPDTLIIPHAKLFVLGTPEQIKLLKQIFEISQT
jgi:voltage-gated potassium channel